ncbi:V8-like Glu-specific endopeptidase [Bradyrhizobium elkanii]|uniref:trypsin-like serine peptidase n=1 Tax=Bradyrhizobium elkanii TaxID=29448 RepID=UPI00216AA5A3|nr:serine protease [Bradyrhizobium elkanii]MCS3689391.1 V8-like Glu-specific endopeptidase [Bradyrhizobium elkanii]
MKQVACALLAALFAACSGPGAAQAPLPEGNVIPINVALAMSSQPGEPMVFWSHTEERPGSAYLRLHLGAIRDRSTIDYTLKILDRAGRDVFAITKAELAGKADYWTGLIDGDYATVKLVAAQMPDGLSFELDRLAYQKNMGAAFSITLPDDREPIVRYKDVPNIFGPSRAIAKLTFIDGLSSAMCTGFLISADRMLTNEHCIRTQATCDTMVVTFGYELDERNTVRRGKQHRCTKFVAADHDLDVAMFAVSDEPGAKLGTLKLNPRPVVPGEQTYLIQHPQGEPMQISRKDCSVTTDKADGNAMATDFGHKCDTLQGSSGSPMIGSDFTVIGLHHFGFDARYDKWRAENRAVRMDRLIEWINKKL